MTDEPTFTTDPDILRRRRAEAHEDAADYQSSNFDEEAYPDETESDEHPARRWLVVTVRHPSYIPGDLDQEGGYIGSDSLDSLDEALALVARELAEPSTDVLLYDLCRGEEVAYEVQRSVSFALPEGERRLDIDRQGSSELWQSSID